MASRYHPVVSSAPKIKVGCVKCHAIVPLHIFARHQQLFHGPYYKHLEPFNNTRIKPGEVK